MASSLKLTTASRIAKTKKLFEMHQLQRTVKELQREAADQLVLEVESQTTFEFLTSQIKAFKSAFDTLPDVFMNEIDGLRKDTQRKLSNMDAPLTRQVELHKATHTEVMQLKRTMEIWSMKERDWAKDNEILKASHSHNIEWMQQLQRDVMDVKDKMHEFKTDVASRITNVCEETNNLRVHWEKQVDDMTERLQDFDTIAQKQAIESRAQTQQRIDDMELMEQAFSTLQKQQLHVRTNLEDHVQAMSSQHPLLFKKMEVLESQCSSQRTVMEQIKSKSSSIEKEQRRRMANVSKMFSTQILRRPLIRISQKPFLKSPTTEDGRTPGQQPATELDEQEQIEMRVDSLPLSPLTSALVALRSTAGARISALPHVTLATSDFLDYGLPQFWSLPRACEANLLSLLHRLAARGISDDVDPYYWRYQCGKGLVSAVKHDNLEMVEWLHECCPSVLPYNAMTEAARIGNVRLLEWLTDRHERAVWLPEAMIAAASTGQTGVLQYLHSQPNKTMYDTNLVFGAAVRGGHLGTLRWLHDHYGHLLTKPIRAVDEAIRDGHTEVVKFVYDHHQLYGETFLSGIDCAARAGDLEMVQWICAKAAPVRDMFYKPIDAAAQGGHLHVVQWLHEYRPAPARWSARAMINAVRGQLLHHDNRTDKYRSTLAMDYAAANGHLDVVRWLHENRSEGCSSSAMDCAAANGHLDVVRWLHENRIEGCTTGAMNWAARDGHLEVVEWLHANREEGCTTEAMNAAAMRGHLDVVKWLGSNRDEGCTNDAMDLAAMNGHLDVVQWLHGRGEGCTVEAMNNAAKNGHLEVTKWLHEHRTEGCTVMAMNLAAGQGHLDVVKWLHENRSEGCTTNAMRWAAMHGYFEVLLFLHANRSEGCGANAIGGVAECTANVEIVQWLHTHYPSSLNMDAMRLGATYMPALLDHLLG